MKKSMLTACAALLLAHLTAADPALAQTGAGVQVEAESKIPVVTVTGQGEDARKPERGVVWLGAEAQAPTAGEAQAQVNKAIQQTIDAVRSLQIENLKIQTANISLNPVYEQRDPRRFQRENQPDDATPRIVAFRASNTIRVQVGDIDKVGAVLDAAVKAGTNTLQGVSFELADQAAARNAALKAAVDNARTQAEVIAGALGMTLGPIVEVSTGGIDRPTPFYARAARMEMAADVGAQVEPGEITTTANVTIVYRLMPKE